MSPLRRILPGAALVSGVLLGLAPACGSGRTPPSVVLVLVDQLRADAAERWMPEVGELARSGVVFENARSVAPWTYPSVISMFSGLYPQQHGADGPPGADKRLSTFDGHLPLLPRLLQRAGYHTSGFVTNPFLHTWNPFHEGFDHYVVDAFIGSEGNLIAEPKLVWTRSMFSNSVNAEVVRYFDGHPVAGPEFTYVHYIDVHGPWDDAPFQVTGELERDYETAVRYVDVRIRELYEYFMARYGGDVVFLVTSDHGQELGDDLRIGEGPPLRQRKRSMHDFNLRIPLMLLPSARVTGPRVVHGPCANVDVLPTILDWAGLAPPLGIRGRSLLPAVRGEPLDPDRSIYARMSAFGRHEDVLYHRGRKYLRLFDPAAGEARAGRRVFDVEADPREERVLHEDFGEEEALLEREAGTAGVEYPKKYEQPSRDVLERLQALGYLGGGEEDR